VKKIEKCRSLGGLQVKVYILIFVQFFVLFVELLVFPLSLTHSTQN